MAASRALKSSFINQFVGQAVEFGNKKEATVAFTTSRSGKDRVSAPVTLEAMHFDDTTKSIKVFCSDGNLRECRVERLPSIEVGRKLWTKLQQIGEAKREVTFIAAGGFSPDKWFYTVEAV